MASQNPPKAPLDSFHIYNAALASLSLPLPPTPPSPLPPTPPSHSKRIPNTRFLVDAFRSPIPSSAAYFLSHFHSDHYSGLSSSWSHGLIFCSPVTASLLTQILRVPAAFVFPLPLRVPVTIDGSEIILLDANHCPGAVQFLFKVPSRNPSSSFEMYVHTGDFRFCESMKLDCLLGAFVGCDAVFLDTTYCNPKFVFPSQDESIDYIVSVVDRIAGEFNGFEKSVLFLVATYVVGKERILLEIARRCKRKVHVDRRKMEVLNVLGYEESGIFTENESESDVHVVGWNVLGETWPYFRPNFVNLKEIMMERGYSRVVGFVPTGWTYEVKRNKFAVRSKDSFEIHLVPYSEHSNYEELREYVKFLKPKRIIPTVGVDVEKLDSKHAIKMQKHFAGLLDEMANKREFLIRFYRGFSEMDEMDAGDGMNEGLDKLNEKKPCETKAFEDDDGGVGLNGMLSPQEPGSQNLTILNEDETDKIIQELNDCLPTWVTTDQKLDLIRSSGRDIVEAVSNFYERETEFHEQVFACTSSTASSAGLLKASESPSKPTSVKSDQGSFGLTLSQKSHISSNAKPLIRSGVSPGKRKRSTNSMSSKKVNSNPKLEAGGSKQSTITSFFNKLCPNVSEGSMVQSTSEQCPGDGNLLPNVGTVSYIDKIDQFIQIIDGGESLRGYAASILERTKGDINKALDLHYCNPEGKLDEPAEKLIVFGSLGRPHRNPSDCSSAQEKNVSDGAGHSVGQSVQESSIENMDTILISLAPEKYNPIEHACWKIGQPAPYIHLARTFDLVEAEKGKIKATSMLCNMFRSLLVLSPEDVLPTVYLCTNKIAADHENVELNIGGGMVASALEEACGVSRSKIREMYDNLGDLGDVAQILRQTQTLLCPPPSLLIKDVFSVLQKISVQTGSGSSVRKKSLIVNLMRSCREKEMKFIVRTLVRNLRIGAMMRTILPALAQAVAMNSSINCADELKAENLKEKIQCFCAAVVEAYNRVPNLDLIVPTLINEGIRFSSSTFSVVPGIPIKPMLAKITKGAAQALKIFQNKAFTCEYKYDGQRAQVHKLSDGNVRVFSRNGDETTSRFPDLINIIKEYCKPTALTFIVDTEVVAVDRKNCCKLLSFQELSSRERGGKDSLITVDDIKVDICVFVFDIIFANGEQLLGFPLRQRRKYLQDLFCDGRLGYFEYAKEITVEAHDACLTNEATLTRMNSFLEDALHYSCEGIMVKSLDVDAGYSPSKRTDTWLKVKRDYVDGLNDSLDLVPIGAWYGNGRKAGWYSPFLMACYNSETEEFQSVCRVMSGFSDAFYIEMKNFFSGDRILSKKPPYYRTAEVPDMWFSPALVWAIRGADLTVSPVHCAAVGLIHPSRGISIRFPRFVRTVSDRNPEECSTAADIAEMFNSQTRKMDVTAES